MGIPISKGEEGGLSEEPTMPGEIRILK